ncbi:MAG: AAA family ATPase [Flavobacteriaceae bacterium]|nr:MAG: AAA family ATPase [Flavobacteriaceae bacterium]
MINKRLLIKNLLAHNDENSFYDKKRKISLHQLEGKAKFLKHVCALSNSNPNNNSFLVIGVQDASNQIVGVDFYDDSKIQNLVNSYFVNPPRVIYENVHFPGLPRHKVVGLVTISANSKTTSLSKQCWKYEKDFIFYRKGSNSMPYIFEQEVLNQNKKTVAAIEKMASNNIKLTLDGVMDFMNRHREYDSSYTVFHEQFVLCWAGLKHRINGKEYYSRVDIELINENIRFFYSAMDFVQIVQNKHSFVCTEYVLLGLEETQQLYPLEKKVIHFKNNGHYKLAEDFLFEPPQYKGAILLDIFKQNNYLIQQLKLQLPLTDKEQIAIQELPTNYMICVLNNMPDALPYLEASKPYLKALDDNTAYVNFKEVMRVLRKVKYNN